MLRTQVAAGLELGSARNLSTTRVWPASPQVAKTEHTWQTTRRGGPRGGPSHVNVGALNGCVDPEEPFPATRLREPTAEWHPAQVVSP